MRGSAPRRRLVGLMRKEMLQIVRDPSSIAIAFVLPAVLLLLFGYGVSLDPTDLRVAIVVENPTPETQSLVAAFTSSRFFDVEPLRHRRQAADDLVAGRVRGAIVLASDFSRQLGRAEEAPIQLILDGTHANTARLLEAYVQGVWASWLTQRALDERAPVAVAITTEPRVWFNPEVRSRNFLVPGLIAIIMALIGTMLTALVVAREWERGTMEALMTTPASSLELLLGKLVPYFLLGMTAMALSVVMAVTLFDVPFRGSILVLTGVTATFLVAALAMGLLISTVARNQFVAGQLSIITAFLPAFMLSGFVFDINSMPQVIQWLTYIIAARYFVSSLQTLFLAGNVWSVILPNAAALALIAAFFLGVTALRTRRRLD
jgi:ABC-2 type transport system permease protein